MQMTTRAARFGARLEALGRRHHEFETRIAAVERQPNPDALILKRLKLEKLRIMDEMACYEGLLRTVSQQLSMSVAAE